MARGPDLDACASDVLVLVLLMDACATEFAPVALDASGKGIVLQNE